MESESLKMAENWTEWRTSVSFSPGSKVKFIQKFWGNILALAISGVGHQWAARRVGFWDRDTTYLVSHKRGLRQTLLREMYSENVNVGSNGGTEFLVWRKHWKPSNRTESGVRSQESSQ